MQPESLRELARKTAKAIVDHGSIPMATLKESIILQEKVDTLLAKEIEFPEVEPYPEMPEFPSEISISNLPEVQKVEITNFPEQKAPIVNVEAPKAPIVNVEAPIINLDNDEVVAELKNISDILSKEEEISIEKTEIVNKKGEVVDLEKLLRDLADRIGNIKVTNNYSGGGASFPQQSQNDIASSSDSLIILRRIAKLLESNATVDVANRQKIVLEGLTTYVGTAAAGVPVGNQITGGAPNSTTNISYAPVWVGPVDQRFVLMDQGRNTYANGIRSNLIFS
jgi:hypothetical protein